MTPRSNDERGAALVLAIGVLAVLAVLAIVIMSVVLSEKKTASAEYAYDRAFYSADAAGEAGVHWIHNQLAPPQTVDSLNNVRAAGAFVALASDHEYTFNVQYVAKRFRPGWSTEYKDYVFQVSARGQSAQQSQASAELSATRLYREGY